MMPPLDLYAYGNGQPENVINYEDWTSSTISDNLRQAYGIFDNVSTLAPSVDTDPGSHGLLYTNSAARRDESYFGGEDSRHAEINLQIFRSSPDYFPLFNRLDLAENFTSDGALAELPPIRDFRFSGHQINEPQTETVQALNGDLAMPFGESLQVPHSMSTMASSLEQEDEWAEARNNSIEDIITSWPAAELYPAIEYPHNFVGSAASPCPAHRSKTGSKRKRSDAESKKHTAEIRISKKIPQNGKLPKGKAWLGTYATAAQKGRALDVGKYFLCTKKRKTFSDPSSEALLSTFRDRLRALPLPELVDIVTKMAKHYGEHGSLPKSLHDLSNDEVGSLASRTSTSHQTLPASKLEFPVQFVDTRAVKL